MQKLWWKSCQAEIGVTWQFLGCLGISEFWTISDWTELGLVELSLCGFLSAVTSFAWVFILLHDMSMGFMCTETTVICFAVLWRVVHALTVGLGLSLQFATSLHYLLFCLRHWSLVDHILPVKMCGTHLGVVVSVIFVGSVIHLLRCESRTLGWTRESLCLAWHEMAELWSAWSL